MTLAREPFGQALLIATAVGLAGYATWRFVRAGAGHGTEQSDSSFRRLVVGFASARRLHRPSQPLLVGRFVHRIRQRTCEYDHLAGVASGVAYAALCFTAVKILTGANSSGGSNSPKQTTGGVLVGWTGATVIVGVVGAILR